MTNGSHGAPLAGIRVVEFEGIGPGPLAGLMLWQLGAEVTLVARPGRGVLPPEMAPAEASLLTRHKQRVVLDLKRKSDVDRALALLAEADVLIEGYRPGVMERLGLGPAPCAAVNPRLVYGRMTGWGQTGPLAQAAGHDMNYVALSGLMSLAARPGALPMLPPTVLGDAAGGLGLVAGLLAGLLRARCSGQGCVVDGAIVDVLAMLAPLVQLVHAGGALDRVNPSVFYGSPFYEVYECADGRHITLGAIEPQFYAELLRRLGLDDVDPNAQMDKPAWPALRERLGGLFRSRDHRHWQSLLEGTDACFAPVLTLEEAARHPHQVARGLYTVDAGGTVETARGLRFMPLQAGESIEPKACQPQT